MASTDQHETAMIEQQADGNNGSEMHQQQQHQQLPQHEAAADNTDRRRRTAVFVHGPVLTVRDRVFHALFYRLALVYARLIPHQLRRIIEFTLLFEVLEPS